MRLEFVTRDSGPTRLVCEAEIVFDDGPLEGMKLVGFCLWRGADDDMYVTFPSRAFGQGSDQRRFYDFLRSVNGAAGAKQVKDWILEEYRRGVAA